MALDAADQASIARLKHALVDQPIDIIINNAGIIGPIGQSAACIEAEGWMTTLRVNALGPVLIVEALKENSRRGSEKKLGAAAAWAPPVSVISAPPAPTSIDMRIGPRRQRSTSGMRSSRANGLATACWWEYRPPVWSGPKWAARTPPPMREGDLR
ncbi:SDR family oxidoreductase [Bradyrhizobium diazoefficiens]|uniref:SDR family oxidoreductase n=1 Tax=Bradyrhizobium diazoefficiens TaxID=1355477 RepID=UPI00190C9110|nr:SDR family oxidoreductase [Bradyrhizobium diazoefficiens]MBK3660983.1 SDR family oxidoreductase [Bradyrhizobium diazoefficiens]